MAAVLGVLFFSVCKFRDIFWIVQEIWQIIPNAVTLHPEINK
jgi:hypothetical protein